MTASNGLIGQHTKDLKNLLDTKIRHWRRERDIAYKLWTHKCQASMDGSASKAYFYAIDRIVAYQELRLELFGAELPRTKKEREQLNGKPKQPQTKTL